MSAAARRGAGGALSLGGVALLVGVLGCTTYTPPADAGTSDAGTRDDGAVDSGGDTCTADGLGATLGATCTDDAGCDDGCFCNGLERCEAGVCVAGADPCVDDVECTADRCLEPQDRCSHEPQHGLCSNGDACDGAEVCDPARGCIPGAPLYCNDESACTLDSCDPARGCVFAPRDLDGDGYVDGRCGGEDCDDDPRTGASVHPGAVEDCENRRDDDCDGLRDYDDVADCTPSNDDCASAVHLPGPGLYSGSTRGLGSDLALGCAAGGPDAVFRFALTAPQDVTVTVAGAGPDAAVALRPWAACAAGPDDGCSANSPPSVLRRSLPAGEHAIVVQSSAPGRAFDLSLRFEAPTPVPPTDVCDADTEDLCGGAPCTVLENATFRGLFAELADDYTLGCALGANRDAAYRFTLTAPKDVKLEASAGATAYLALTTDCARSEAERRCASGSPAQIEQRELPPGTYYVLVESASPSASAYELTVTMRDAGARTLGDAGSAATDISEAMPNEGGAGMVDAVRLTLDPGTSCGGVDAACDAGTTAACAPGAPATLHTTLDPGADFRQVESDSAAPSALDLYPTFFSVP